MFDGWNDGGIRASRSVIPPAKRPRDGTSVWTSLGPVGNFTGGGAPFARLASAYIDWFAAGNTIYVGDNHAELPATRSRWLQILR